MALQQQGWVALHVSRQRCARTAQGLQQAPVPRSGAVCLAWPCRLVSFKALQRPRLHEREAQSCQHYARAIGALCVTVVTSAGA